MFLQKSFNNKVFALFFIGILFALALGGIFLYALRGMQEADSSVQFGSPAALVNTYIASIRTLETAYIENSAPVTIDAVLFRFTDMRVPQEVLDTHLRSVLALEQMKKETLTGSEMKTRLAELFTRMRLAAEKIIL